MARLRTHQRQVDRVCAAMAEGAPVRDILAAVTPGGGKSLLPVIAASRLIQAGVAERVCWVVPRDTLRLQAEEAFADPFWREGLGHALSVRAADNGPDPCRGGQGYVTTYQAVAAAPDLHLAEFRRHRYLLAIDELHHLPGLQDLDPLTLAADETSWSRSLLPLLESASARLLMSGTLERADGKPILWLPYKAPGRQRGGQKVRRIDFEAPGWAVVGYSRRQALAEQAILPVTFGAMDGEAEWRFRAAEAATGPIRLSQRPDLARPALYTAFRTGFADGLLEEAFSACRAHRLSRRQAQGLRAGEPARGLGKLLVVATDQKTASLYFDKLRARFPADLAGDAVRLAVSEAGDAAEAIAAFRLRPEPSILVTVAMAYEGMDCPEVSHVACLTHIRSRPWLEQLIARAVRVDPRGGPYEGQAAVVYHPDDPLFRQFRHAIETDQGTKARLRRPVQRDLFEEETQEGELAHADPGIEPLSSNTLALRFDIVAPGPDFGSAPESNSLAKAARALAEVDRAEPPSAAEHRLRQRIGALVAAQVVEDEDAHLYRLGRPPGYHAYNAVLKRVLGKGRGEMGLAELEAALAWLGRNRIADHINLLDGDTRYTAPREKARGVRLGRQRIKA